MSGLLAELVVGRTLRRAEQAIDVLKLDKALNDAKDELEQAIRDELARVAAAWADSGGTRRPAVTVTPEMRAVLDELRTLGRREALLELERIGVTGRRFAAEPAPDGRDVLGYLARELPALGLRIEDELVAADLAGASFDAIAHALLQVPGARDIASRVVSTALFDGMGQTFEDNAHLLDVTADGTGTGWEYTAVLDGGTCPRCRDLDGSVYDTWAEIQEVLPNGGPNPTCLGGGRCRCRAVPRPPE